MKISGTHKIIFLITITNSFLRMPNATAGYYALHRTRSKQDLGIYPLLERSVRKKCIHVYPRSLC